MGLMDYINLRESARDETQFKIFAMYGLFFMTSIPQVIFIFQIDNKRLTLIADSLRELSKPLRCSNILKYTLIGLVIFQSLVDASIEVIFDGLFDIRLPDEETIGKFLICLSVPNRLIIDVTLITIMGKNFLFFSKAYE